jgi:hypothetical protein
MSDRRKELRMPADKDAVIHGVPGRDYITCRVIDVSDGGACLELGPEGTLPDRFDVILDFCLSASCKVMWRYQNKLGVAFGQNY